MVYVSEGARISKLPREVIGMLDILVELSQKHKRHVVISGKDDDVYRLDGAHARGYAVDIRGDAKVAEDKIFFWELEQRLSKRFGKGKWVVYFGDKRHMDHCHAHLVKGEESGE